MPGIRRKTTRRKSKLRIPLPAKPGGPHQEKRRKHKSQQQELRRSLEEGLAERRKSDKEER